MNLHLTMKTKGILSIGFLICGLLMTSVSLMAQTSKEYTDAEVDALVADIEANSYNEYILTTDGGNYVMSDVDLAGDAVVKAKEGLTKKPVISDESNTSTYRAFFDIQNGTYNLTVQGLEFNGTATEAMLGVSRVRSDSSSIQILDCDIHDFSTGNGFVRADKAGVSIVVDGCYVYNCNTRLVYLYSNSAVYGDVSVTNTTFANSTGKSAIYYRDSGGTTAGGNNLTVDHCTFYNIPGGSPVIKVGDEMAGTVSVTNSVFVQVGDSLKNIDVLDYCYLAGLEKNVIGTNTLETAPVFANADEGDFAITNAAELVGSDGKTAGSLKWYANASEGNEYSTDDVEKLISDISDSKYNTYILTSAGGVYDLSAAPDISVSTTIKGADDLEARPVLSYTANGSSSFGIFRVRNASERIAVTFENLEFDCSNDKGNVTRIDSEIDLLVKNCFIHDNNNSNGSIRVNSAGCTVTFENTLVNNCKQRVICLYTPEAVYGAVNISNSTFSNIAGPVIYYRSSGGVVAIGSDVTVDHATFSNIGGSEGVFKFRDMQGDVVVKNSIFDAVAGSLDDTYVTADYCYVAGFETAPLATNSIETTPAFADAANLNFTLLNSADLQAGDMQILGDLTWYSDEYAPKAYNELVRIDDTHLQLSFNETVDIESASSSQNYVLSGTFGLTGNPVSVTLNEDGKSVTLEVADLAAIQTNETVIVTVSNVSDLVGNVIDENNVATYIYLDEIAPVVTLEAQEVTNALDATVTAQSNEAGMLYLMQDGVEASLKSFTDAIEAGKGSSSDVAVPGTDVTISTARLLVGIYNVYAIDGYENISAKSENTVTITDPIIPLVSVEAAELTNAANAPAVVVTSTEAGWVYMILAGEAMSSQADLELAVTNLKGAKAKVERGTVEGEVSMAGVEPGSYVAIAVDEAGNVSVASENAVTVTEYVPNINYYAVEDAAKLSADIVNANNGDVFVLTTSGGEYNLEYWHKLTASITIMADPDLEKRPIISNYRESSTYQTFRLYAPGASLILKGIEIDSKNHATYPLKYMLRVASDIGNYHLVADDCYFHGEMKSTGAIVKTYGGTHADSIIFRNCIFEGFEAINMEGLSSENSPSWDRFEVTNCTFINVPEQAIVIKDQPSVNKDYPVVVDHCSFYNVGSEDKNTIVADSMRNVTISNSIFSNCNVAAVVEVYGDETSQSTFTNNTVFESGAALAVGTANIVENNWNSDPQFADAANGDLTLGNQELWTLGTDQLPLGDLRWADVLGPKVLPDVMAYSDSTLLIRFDEWIDTLSALNPENYAISGSAGLSGNAKEVELFNFHAVLITTESFMSQVGKDVIVTVSGVQDLNGNSIDQKKNSAVYVVEQLLPVVYANNQSVTNADGEVAVVQSSLGSGTVYLVLEDVVPSSSGDLDNAVAQFNAAKTDVTGAYVDIEISTYQLTPGTYHAYMTDDAGNLSEKSEGSVQVKDGIAPVVSAEIQSADNSSEGMVYVQSNEDNGRVYIMMDGEPQATFADFITAVALKKGAVADVSAAATDVAISTTDLVPGIYYAYAVDGAGNISEVGENPINITEKTAVDDWTILNVNVKAINQQIVVEVQDDAIENISVYTSNGRLIQKQNHSNQRFQSMILTPGLYIVHTRTVNKSISVDKVVIN